MTRRTSRTRNRSRPQGKVALDTKTGPGTNRSPRGIVPHRSSCYREEIGQDLSKESCFKKNIVPQETPQGGRGKRDKSKVCVRSVSKKTRGVELAGGVLLLKNTPRDGLLTTTRAQFILIVRYS